MKRPSSHPKPAPTRTNVAEIIKQRWSPRSFADRPISQDDLLDLLEAARWTASSNNEQPWRFVVTTKADGAAHDVMLGLLVARNQEWAKNAPVLMITTAKKTFSNNGQPNRYGMHDTGAALTNLMLQAAELGLSAHGMAGFDQEAARKVLGVPDDYEIGAAVAVGYADAPEKLTDERMRQQETAPRVRKPLAEIAFSGKFGAALSER